MNAYSMGIGATKPKERKSTTNRQESLALSLHRRREGERLGRQSWKRGAALVAGGTIAGGIIIALLFRSRKRG